MPANFTEKEREKIRQDLIDAGFQMSRECGLKGMTVSKLAERCHIAKGTFYHFFASKKNLYLHCLQMRTAGRGMSLRR